jgi:6-phosphogluconolactonase (cycloisomerase 2 family)
MGMKFRFLRNAWLFLALLGFTACSSSNSSTASSGSGLLYLATQGNTTLTSYSVGLSSGSLSGINTAGTGSAPAAIAIVPGGTALFVANSASNSVSSYQVNSDGSLTAVSGTIATGTTPMGLAIDPAGKFLFVANQGSGDISVFSISGTSLTAVGSPVLSDPNSTVPTGPVALAIPPAGGYLYVANQFTNTVSAFSFDSSGALTAVPNSPYAVGTAPSALDVPQGGQFLLVANAGSNNISSFAICVVASATCSTPNGIMTEVANSPFAAGIGPVAIAADPGFDYVYVVDKTSNQISEYSFSTGTGALTLLSNPTISTGTTPVAIIIFAGATGTNVGNPTNDPTDYVYVANSGGSSLSAFTLTTSSGLLNILGQAVTTAGQPAALSGL